MSSGKYENLLELALSDAISASGRSEALPQLQQQDGRWEIIVRCTEDLTFLMEQYPDLEVTMLLFGYAILILPRELISVIAALEAVVYIELPRRLFFSSQLPLSSSCLAQTIFGSGSLSGRGVLIGVVDSGVEVRHPAFRTREGKTRIRAYWDQTAAGGEPPGGYRFGREYSMDELNQALEANQPLPRDESGHGTAVAGIAAGREFPEQSSLSQDYRGVAVEAELLVVKMRQPQTASFPRTSELMCAINYCVEKAAALRMPLALNISFGNNYGSHTGTSLLETYISQVSSFGRTSIIIGTGNEGVSGIHTKVILNSFQTATIPLAVASPESSFSVQIWSYSFDTFEVEILSPSGEAATPVSMENQVQVSRLENTELLSIYGEPAPYSLLREIFIEFLPLNRFVNPGIWRFRLKAAKIRAGTVHMWLPGGGILNASTRFLRSSPELTLTIPSTALSGIGVGAYDPSLDAYADFSGRGEARIMRKPDLLAPGVDLLAPAVPRGYASVTGTSFAAPVVTGSAALLMEWGLIRGNDPFLYGEKLKAALIRGARPLPGDAEDFQPESGWGTLCVFDSIPR